MCFGENIHVYLVLKSERKVLGLTIYHISVTSPARSIVSLGMGMALLKKLDIILFKEEILKMHRYLY